MMRRIGAWAMLALFAVLLVNILFIRFHAVESAMAYGMAVVAFLLAGGLRWNQPAIREPEDSEPGNDETDDAAAGPDDGKVEPERRGESHEVIAQVVSDLEQARAKKRGMRLLANLLIVAGLGLVLVPLALTWYNQNRNASAVDDFLSEAASVADGAASMAAGDSGDFYEGEVDFGQELMPPGALSTGETSESSQTTEGTAATTAESTETTASEGAAPTKKPMMSKEEIRKRMTGVLIIDKIDVKLPILDGVDDETLRVAAGRMPESGKLDEIGNVVLAGHRSYTFGKYFNRLDELAEGDKITVTTKEKTLHYVVYKKYVVEPNDFSILNYNNTDKILTLFTCTPVVVASHRLVVQALQVE